MAEPELLPEAPRVSVIIPHLNTPALLEKCLRSVERQQLDRGSFEIIVVDNGSSVPPADIVSAHTHARMLIQPVAGPGPARNMGIAAARAPLVACIDADCIAETGWLQAAVDALDAEADRPAGGEVSILVAAPPFMTGIESYESVFGFRQLMYIEKKGFSVTANLALTKALFDKIGPFGGIEIAEDLEWGQRALKLGHATRHIPQMRVQHPARPDMTSLERKWQRHISHDWTERTRNNAGRFGWYLKAIALVCAIPLQAVSIFMSPKVAGVGNCLRGIVVLAKIRNFRCKEMLRVANSPGAEGYHSWNRQ